MQCHHAKVEIHLHKSEEETRRESDRNPTNGTSSVKCEKFRLYRSRRRYLMKVFRDSAKTSSPRRVHVESTSSPLRFRTCFFMTTTAKPLSPVRRTRMNRWPEKSYYSPFIGFSLQKDFISRTACAEALFRKNTGSLSGLK